MSESLTAFLLGLLPSLALFVATLINVRGTLAKAEANAKVAKLENTSQTERQYADAREYMMSNTRRLEADNDKLEAKVEVARGETVKAIAKGENVQGQVNVLLADQTASKKLVADHILMIGQQVAEIASLRAQLAEGGTSYRKELDDLKAQVQDLQKQVKNLTEMLAQVTKERDTAVDKLAAQTPVPIAMSPATATP